jgi:H+/Cl- antiporter ClcA
MKEKLRQLWTSALENGIVFLKWLLFSCLIGLVVGLVGSAFHYAIEWATEVRAEHDWVLFFLPFVGAVIVLMYKVCGMERDRGTNFVLAAVRENSSMRLRTAPLIIVATVLTHLAGGSAGREGAALQMGGSISSKLGRWMKLDEKDERVITMCGMAAGFSALFGTPLAAAMLAMEVVSVGVLYYAAIVPCTLSALIALMVSGWLGIAPTAFSVAEVPALDPFTLIRCVILGVLFALLSMLFCVVMHTGNHLYAKAAPDPIIRAVLGGLLVVALTLLVGTRDYNGAGMDVIVRAIGGEARPEAFLLKMLFTALTLCAGFKGGEIVPTFFTGATFGCVVGPMLGLPASFSASAGMVAVFCGVTNCPLTSILLAYELFGGSGLPLYAALIAVSYMLSGYYGLYSEQKIVYSKLRPEFIDTKTK